MFKLLFIATLCFGTIYAQQELCETTLGGIYEADYLTQNDWQKHYDPSGGKDGDLNVCKGKEMYNCLLSEGSICNGVTCAKGAASVGDITCFSIAGVFNLAAAWIEGNPIATAEMYLNAIAIVNNYVLENAAGVKRDEEQVLAEVSRISYSQINYVPKVNSSISRLAFANVAPKTKHVGGLLALLGDEEATPQAIRNLAKDSLTKVLAQKPYALKAIFWGFGVAMAGLKESCEGCNYNYVLGAQGEYSIANRNQFPGLSEYVTDHHKLIGRTGYNMVTMKLKELCPKLAECQQEQYREAMINCLDDPDCDVANLKGGMSGQGGGPKGGW